GDSHDFPPFWKVPQAGGRRPSGPPPRSGGQEYGHPKQPASRPPAAGAVRPAMHPPEGGDSSHFYLAILRLKFAVPSAPTRRTQSGSSCSAPLADPMSPRSTTDFQPNQFFKISVTLDLAVWSLPLINTS